MEKFMNIGDQVTSSDWINIKDRHPIDGEFVLIYAPDERHTKIRICECDDNWDRFCRVLHITHWMPLPSIIDLKELQKIKGF
jgi:hypothetical protein